MSPRIRRLRRACGPVYRSVLAAIGEKDDEEQEWDEGCGRVGAAGCEVAKSWRARLRAWAADQRARQAAALEPHLARLRAFAENPESFTPSPGFASVLALPTSLTHRERVDLQEYGYAQRLGLRHESQGFGPQRRLVVSRGPPKQHAPIEMPAGVNYEAEEESFELPP